jgi:hypothetical protein
MSLLRLVLIGEILCADASLLVLLAEVMQECGLLSLAAELKTPHVRPRQGTLQVLRRSGADHQ